MLVPANPEDDPKTCEQWRRVDNPNEMMQLLQACNQKHFGQSKDCTLTSPPLDFTMKFSATCSTADAILEGTYLTPTILAPAPDTILPNATQPAAQHTLAPHKQDYNIPNIPSARCATQPPVRTTSPIKQSATSHVEPDDSKPDTQDSPSHPPLHSPH